MRDPWPFADPENEAVLPVRQVFNGSPILLVCHDHGDGGWQFLTGGDLSMKDAMLVAFDEVVCHDRSLLALADLPEGWQATRASVGQPWSRAPLPPPDPDEE